MSAARLSKPRYTQSLRVRLAVGLLVPLLLLLALNAHLLHRQALNAANTAYDRTLLASAKAIGELLELSLDAQGHPRLEAQVVYGALEAFEADNRSRIFYRVNDFDGTLVNGFEALKPWRGRIPDQTRYAALVDFYDDDVQGVPVRVAVLLQPVAGAQGVGMASIQVAETLELRQALARELLWTTLWQQSLLLLVLIAVVLWVVHAATAPVRALSCELQGRADDALEPLRTATLPSELEPLVTATNAVLLRLKNLLERQQQFVRNAAHQLRTPLAVLKVQVQSARSGDMAPQDALAEIDQTVHRATELANQMLSLAKVDQLSHPTHLSPQDLLRCVRAVALDLAPLAAARDIDLELLQHPLPSDGGPSAPATADVWVLAHEWMLQELTRNLLHNALKFSPPGARLSVCVYARGVHAVLEVHDQGPGLSPEQRATLFRPFSASVGGGSGLGLSICQQIMAALGGQLHFDDRAAHTGLPGGLSAVVCLTRVGV